MPPVIADFSAREEILNRVHRAVVRDLLSQLEIRVSEAVRASLVALPVADLLQLASPLPAEFDADVCDVAGIVVRPSKVEANGAAHPAQD